jgi:hypothetical protein
VSDLHGSSTSGLYVQRVTAPVINRLATVGRAWEAISQQLAGACTANAIGSGRAWVAISQQLALHHDNLIKLRASPAARSKRPFSSVVIGNASGTTFSGDTQSDRAVRGDANMAQICASDASIYMLP